MATSYAKTVDGIGRTNTKIYNENGHFAVQLHSTVVYDEDRELGLITLNNGGWITQTTVRRMNQALAHRGFDLHVAIRKGGMVLIAPQTATPFEGNQLTVRIPKGA